MGASRWPSLLQDIKQNGGASDEEVYYQLYLSERTRIRSQSTRGLGPCFHRGLE